ncbi:hypothetical protein ASPBRDRAFT_40454 [Aspergillus brasiliensis CBS 101740]|uniref:Uncharacterized protein n=1 Tax=Aspergillus brasiliensis (strain CBS 101740 / IMI 381727 / IBT 21946) TaxID=767769 RepID=A0A1L9UU62_ASPBC|nr:hypothetical protein ASPBRDRAFT_40454 [Aspergillus brasiliensis CBS 101740]
MTEPSEKGLARGYQRSVTLTFIIIITTIHHFLLLLSISSSAFSPSCSFTTLSTKPLSPP